MFTEIIRPWDPTSKLITEATFVIEKNVTERASLSNEHVGDYPENGNPCPTIELGRTVSPQSNSAGGFPRRPGLNHNVPSYIVGIRYSVCFDDLLPIKRSSASFAPRDWKRTRG
jgi:hypothetical protein